MAKERRVYVGTDRALIHRLQKQLRRVFDKWQLNWQAKFPADKTLTLTEADTMLSTSVILDRIKDMKIP